MERGATHKTPITMPAMAPPSMVILAPPPPPPPALGTAEEEAVEGPRRTKTPASVMLASVLNENSREVTPAGTDTEKGVEKSRPE